ncbi:MAG: terminase small subunit [Rhodospirillaceae bacterium]|nr:terminase small subunit [Rhodospirillaceae bacterium]
MPFDPDSPSAPAAAALADLDWPAKHREWLPYWQQNDPVPPRPETPSTIETPGEVLTERQEAFCRAYLECPVGGKAARLAGYAPDTARQQASRLLKHPLIVRRLHDLRAVRGKDYQVRRDTLIDQAEAVFEAAMEKNDHYAAMQALTMKARLAGFADYLPGVRILRRETRHYEEEFWARAHAAEQRIMAARLGEIAGEGLDRGALGEARADAEMFADGAESAAHHLALEAAGAAERRGRNAAAGGRRKRDGTA